MTNGNRSVYDTEVSKDVAGWVLWCKTKGRQGLSPGSFVESLLGTIWLADLENTEKLGLGFPEFVAASYMSAAELARIAAGQR